MKLACLALLLGLGTSGVLVGADRLASQWIGPQRGHAAPVTLQRTFPVKADTLPQQASLKIASDFCTATIQLNGKTVLTTSPFDDPIPVDVGRWLRHGGNELHVELRDLNGPAAVAVELELGSKSGSSDLGVVHSDGAWRIDSPGAQPVNVFGPVDQEPWWSIKTLPSTDAFDEYNQWRDAKTEQGSASAKLSVPPGFEIETVYRVPEEYGSWISMTKDDRGRLIVGSEKKGVFRLNVVESEPTVESINADLKGCHGVLWCDGNLFVNASDSKALYRLRDTVGDDQYDESKLLREIPGRGGDHGRNDLAIGPNGFLYSIHGDAVDLPDGFTSRVPVTREYEDGRPRGGHLVRTDLNGSTWQVQSAGLRNPYGLAFNRDGEVFTYDADSERHYGLPWYRPTRMNHLVPGADYGWRSRRGELPWPTYHADILPPNKFIGRGSPTSVKFAYDSNFPEAWRDAMIAPDWSFGRIFAVHVVPRGASYSMHPVTFMRGRPLNVCDIDFATDGSMYLLTGGYGTRSILYRVRYVGPEKHAWPPTSQMRARELHSVKLRELRRSLEQTDVALEQTWELLDHTDAWIRHAARLALERQPKERWRERIWTEPNPARSLPALLALVRVGEEVDLAKARSHLADSPLDDLSIRLSMVVVRITQWLKISDAGPNLANQPGKLELIASKLTSRYPSGHSPFDREVCRLLVDLNDSTVVRKTLDLLADDLSQNDQLHYLSTLTKAEDGWTPNDREEFFRLLLHARLSQGDESVPPFLKELEANAVAALPESLSKVDRDELVQILSVNSIDAPVDEIAPPAPRKFVRKWFVENLVQPPKVEPDLKLGGPGFSRGTMCTVSSTRCFRSIDGPGSDWRGFPIYPARDRRSDCAAIGEHLFAIREPRNHDD